MSVQKPLAGMTIVEAVNPRTPIALALAAGLCGRLALDLGACVIRIEQRQGELSPEIDGFLNLGKTRVEASADSFIGAIQQACGKADGIIADAGTLNAINVSDVCQMELARMELAMSHDDPLGGSEFTLEARSGLLDLVGDPARAPLRLGGHQIAYAAGLAAYLGLVDMLTKRGAGPVASHRRVDLLDIAVWLNWKAIGGAAMGLPVPTRTGSNGEWCVAPCRDGYVALVYRSKDWDSLKRMLNDVRLDDPHFDTDAGRSEHRAKLNALLRENFAVLDRAEVRCLALEYRIPLGPVWSPEELRDDPHYQARNFFHSRVHGGQMERNDVHPARNRGDCAWMMELRSPLVLQPVMI